MFWKPLVFMPRIRATRPFDRRRLLWPAGWLFSFVWLVACGRGTDPSAVTWLTHTDETWGLTFQAPDTWSVTTEEADVITITHPDQDVSAQLFMTPTAEFAALGLNEPAAFLQFFSDAFLGQGEQTGNLEVVEALQTTTIHGLSAATLTLSGTLEDNSGVLRLAALGNETTLVVVLGADGAPGNPYGAVLEQLIQSIELTP